MLNPVSSRYLYVIQSTNLDGIPIYSKGKLIPEKAGEVYYSRFIQTHYAREIIDYDEHHCVSIVRKRENPACPARLAQRVTWTAL